MSLKLPVVAFNCSYNKATTFNQCIYFKNTEDLLNIIQNIDHNQIEKISVAMKRIADERYKWEIISNKYESLINIFSPSYKKQNLKSDLSKLDSKTLYKLGLSHLKNITPYYK